ERPGLAARFRDLLTGKASRCCSDLQAPVPEVPRPTRRLLPGAAGPPRGENEPHLPRQCPPQQGGAERATARDLGPHHPPRGKWRIAGGRTRGCIPAQHLGCPWQEEVEAKGDTDRLTLEVLKGLVNKPELLELTESLTPDQTVAFWMPESEMEVMELELGTGVRLKTRGDGPFIDSLAKLELGTVTKCNFAGDGKTGASWTDNIMAQKSSERNTAEIREQGDGAEDEEWDD
uniref:Arpin n=1 Tax=Rattus norvegicus TaxID=10116 RepID=A0A8I5ZPJ3_RAT